MVKKRARGPPRCRSPAIGLSQGLVPHALAFVMSNEQNYGKRIRRILLLFGVDLLPVGRHFLEFVDPWAHSEAEKKKQIPRGITLYVGPFVFVFSVFSCDLFLC